MVDYIASRRTHVNYLFLYAERHVRSVKMTLDEIQTKLEAGVEGSTVTMEGDGCNCSTLVVSPIFEGMSLLARQKMVLAAVRENIDSGELHALSIKARTPAENS